MTPEENDIFLIAVTFQWLLFLAILWCVCVCVCVTERSELITAVSLRFPVCECVCVCLCVIFHPSVLIVTAVLWLITWSDSVNMATNPSHCCEQEKGREGEGIICFHWYYSVLGKFDNVIRMKNAYFWKNLLSSKQPLKSISCFTGEM